MTTRTWFHLAVPTYSRARPKNAMFKDKQGTNWNDDLLQKMFSTANSVPDLAVHGFQSFRSRRKPVWAGRCQPTASHPSKALYVRIKFYGSARDNDLFLLTRLNMQRHLKTPIFFSQNLGFLRIWLRNSKDEEKRKRSRLQLDSDIWLKMKLLFGSESISGPHACRYRWGKLRCTVVHSVFIIDEQNPQLTLICSTTVFTTTLGENTAFCRKLFTINN